MADYALTAAEEPCAVTRASDGAWIPADMANTDYNCPDPTRPGYVQWKEAGGVPDPYVEPPPPEAAPPTPEQTVLFDHENRVLALEGKPPITVEDFVAKASRMATPTAAKPAPKARSR